MKSVSWVLFVSAVAAFLFVIFQPSFHVQAAPGPHAPVVVELFTSEGCSSCPPADQLLIDLQRQSRPDAEIIVLSEHVDYWDYIGWHDPFSARQFSDRQSAYAQAFSSDEVYTPQMVVDGAVGFTGSDTSRASKEIAKAATRVKGNIAVEAREIPGSVLSVVASGDALKDNRLMITFAVTEDGLESHVKRGENSGRMIAHTGVVRALKEIPLEGALAKTVFDVRPEWRHERLRVVAFAQDATRKVVAVGSVRLE